MTSETNMTETICGVSPLNSESPFFKLVIDSGKKKISLDWTDDFFSDTIVKSTSGKWVTRTEHHIDGICSEIRKAIEPDHKV